MSGALIKAFLDDIAANIDDDAPRLIFADWLQEHGHDDRAEFIRVQIERSRLPAWDAAQVRLRLREQALLDRHGEAWLAEMPRIDGAKWEGFRRGVVAEVSFASFEAMRQKAHECRKVAPVEAVAVDWPRRGGSGRDAAPIAELRELVLHGRPFGDRLPRLADSLQLSTLRSLDVLGLDVADLVPLVSSPHLANLRTLRLVSNGLGNAGVRALVEAATLTGLEELDLSGPGYHESYYQDPILTEDGAAALAAWPGLRKVRSLNLNGSNLGPGGFRDLLGGPFAIGLRHLSLHAGRFDGAALAAFRDAPRTVSLETLDLGQNLLGEIGAEYVALAPCLRELKSLRLDRCEIPLAGATHLATATFRGGLRLLDAGHNHFGPAGLAACLDGLAALHTLRLADNDLFDKGATLLAASPASDRLLEIDLRANGFGPAAAQALAETAHLRDLLFLRLARNDIPADAAVSLRESPLGRRLAVLEVERDFSSRPDWPGMFRDCGDEVYDEDDY